MIYNIKVYNNYSGVIRVFQNVQYDSDNKSLICNGDNTQSMNSAIVAIANPNKFTIYLSKDDKNTLSVGENDGLIYDMVESIEFSNLNKFVYVCTNILSSGKNNSIVRIDHILRNSTSTEYYITKDGWDAIKTHSYYKRRRN